MSPATRARKMARVHQLAGKGDTNRVIAKKVGVSEATVRRWRRTTRASDDAPDDAPGDAPAPDTGATHDAADCVTGASPAASSDAPECVTTASSPASESDHLTAPLDAAADAPTDAPPTRDDAPHDAVVVPLDDDLRQALATLAEGGYDAAVGLRMCAQFVAGALTHSWDHNVLPRGVIPPMRVQFKPLAPTSQTRPIHHGRDETLTP